MNWRKEYFLKFHFETSVIMFKVKRTIPCFGSVVGDNAAGLFIVFSACPRGPFMGG